MVTGGPPSHIAVYAMVPDTAAPSLARSRIRETLVSWNLDGLMDDCELLVSELVTNVVHHAQAATSVVLCLRADAQRLRIEVSDDGAGGKIIAMRSAPDHRGGYGLRVIAELSDRWGVDQHDGLNTAWFEMNRP